MKVLKSFEDFFTEPVPAVNTNPVDQFSMGSHSKPNVQVPGFGDDSMITDDGGEGNDVEFTVDDDDLEPEDDDDLDEGKDPYAVTSKDTMRIQDIHDKADGDKFKMERLAQTMCKLITNAAKATRRALAAESLKFYDIADLFFARARELGGA